MRIRIALRTAAIGVLLTGAAACAPRQPVEPFAAAEPVTGNAERGGSGEPPSGDAPGLQHTQAPSRDKDADGAARPARAAESDAGPAAARPQATADQAKQDQAVQGAARGEDAERLQRQLDGLQVKPTPRGIVVTFGNVVFKTNSAELLPDALSNLDRLAAYLKESQSTVVKVEGYTDSSSSAGYNLGLSQRRADSLRQALVARGVDASRIDARGYGGAAPVAGNDTAEGRQMNRRVEVVIGGPGGQAPQASGAAR